MPPLKKPYRSRLAPATGIVRWLKAAPNGNRRLLISVSGREQVYEVVQEPPGFKLLRYGVGKEPEIVCYKIELHNLKYWSCSCPDADNRPERDGQCKHVRGLRAGLRSLPF